MTDPPRDIERRSVPRTPGDRPPGTPGWVKAFALIAIVLVALFVIRHLVGGGLARHLQG